MVTRQTLCGWSMEVLWSSVKLGFAPVFGKLGEGAVKLLPNGQRPHLPVHFLYWEILVRPPVIGFLVGLVFNVRLVWSVQGRLYVDW